MLDRGAIPRSSTRMNFNTDSDKESFLYTYIKNFNKSPPSFVMEKYVMLIDKENISAVRKIIQAFNEDLGVYINDDDRHKLGKVLTIIDASISDPEQRKAIKDLINDSWWNKQYKYGTDRMVNPHSDLRAICQVLGFEMYPDNYAAPEVSVGEEEYTIKRYKKIAKEADKE